MEEAKTGRMLRISRMLCFNRVLRIDSMRPGVTGESAAQSATDADESDVSWRDRGVRLFCSVLLLSFFTQGFFHRSFSKRRRMASGRE